MNLLERLGLAKATLPAAARCDRCRRNEWQGIYTNPDGSSSALCLSCFMLAMGDEALINLTRRGKPL